MKTIAPAVCGVGLAKIDVQGHGDEVLKGAIDLLQAYHPSLYFENSPDSRGAVAPETLFSVARLGYECTFQFGMVICI